MVPPSLAEKFSSLKQISKCFKAFQIPVSYNDETLRQSLIRSVPVRFGSSEVHSQLQLHWFAPTTSSLKYLQKLLLFVIAVSYLFIIIFVNSKNVKSILQKNYFAALMYFSSLIFHSSARSCKARSSLIFCGSLR